MKNEENKSHHRMPILFSLLGGGSIGLVEGFINHPLWVIKTRLQARLAFTLDPKILYRGIFAQALATCPMDMVQISVANILNERLFNNKSKQNILSHGISGFMGGFISGFVACPVEMAMTQMQKQNKAKSSMAMIQEIYFSGGLSAVFRGLLGTSFRTGLYCLGFYTSIPQFKKFLQEKYDWNEFNSSIFSGLFMGSLTSLVSHIPDTIKTVQQAETPSKNFGLLSAIKKIYKTRGVLGFFDGFIARSIRITSAAAIMGYLTEVFEDSYHYGFHRIKNHSENSRKNDNLKYNVLDVVKIFSVQLTAFSASFLESCIDYPFIGIKIALQTGKLDKKKLFERKKILTNIRESYRGLLPFQASLIPSTIIQFSIIDKIRNDTDTKQLLFVSFIAGIVSSLYMCPAEQVIVFQKKYAKNPFKIITEIVKNQGIKRFFCGYNSIAFREAISSLALWGGSDVIRDYLKKKTNLDDKNLFGPTLIASILLSIPASVITHPVDTVKTQMQDIEGKSTFWRSVKGIYEAGGIKGFFPGVVPRTISFAGFLFFTRYFENLITTHFNRNQTSTNKNFSSIKKNKSTFFAENNSQNTSEKLHEPEVKQMEFNRMIFKRP